MRKKDINKAVRWVLKHRLTLNRDLFFHLSMLVIALITVYPWFKTGLACGDDMASYIVAHSDTIFSNAKFLAELQGRFTYLIIMPVQSIAFLWDSMFVTKLFQVIPILVSLFLFSRIVEILTKSRELSLLYVLLFFVTAQVSRHTSLFVNYPFCFPFSFSLIMLSYLLIHRFQKRKNYWALVFSAVLFAFGLVFYEMYILFIWFVFLSVSYHNFMEGKRGLALLKNVALQMLPFLIIAISYLAVYVMYGHAHPSQYGGNQMTSNTSIFKSFFAVLWGLTNSALPLTVYDSSRTFFANKSDFIDGYHNIVPYLFAHARVEWLIKAVLVAGMSYFLLLRIPRIGYRTLLIGFLFAVMFTFFPHIPLALTQKYIFYVTTQGMLGYVTTFFSFFGVVLFLSVLAGLLLTFTGKFTLLRHVTALVLTVGFVLCGFLMDFSNYYVCQDINQASLRLYTVDEMLKSDRFKAIPQNSNIYARELWNNPSVMAGGLTVQNFEWSYYFYAKARTSQAVYHNDSTFLSNARKSPDPPYRVLYEQAIKSDEAMLAVAQLKPPGPDDTKIDSVSGKILVVYYSINKQFSVTFEKLPSPLNEKVRIRINHINGVVGPGESGRFIIYNTKFNEPATIFTIECPGMLIKSLHISNLIYPDWDVYYL